MTCYFLLFNSDKKDILLIGPKTFTQKLLEFNWHLDGRTVTTTFTVKKLGDLIDSNLSFENLYCYKNSRLPL